jgi:hypothetical protein
MHLVFAFTSRSLPSDKYLKRAKRGPSILIETQVVPSKSELLKELQGLPVTKAVIYRNVDKRAWEQIAKEHQGVRYVVMVIR